MNNLYKRFRKLIERTDIKIIWTNLDKHGNLRVCLKYAGEEVVADVVEDENGYIVCK